MWSEAFLSTKIQREDILLGLNLGAFDYLMKPFDLDFLGKKIHIALQNRKKNPDIAKRQITV
jgi:DNA-binding response OmpR family regulator